MILPLGSGRADFLGRANAPGKPSRLFQAPEPKAQILVSFSQTLELFEQENNMLWGYSEALQYDDFCSF